MMNLFNKYKVPGGVILIAGGLLYLYFTYFASSSAPLLSSGTTGAGAPVSQELLVTLGSLHTIKLSQDIFNDPVFKSLADFGVTIPDEPKGRRNPFAAVGK